MRKLFLALVILTGCSIGSIATCFADDNEARGIELILQGARERGEENRQKLNDTTGRIRIEPEEFNRKEVEKMPDYLRNKEEITAKDQIKYDPHCFTSASYARDGRTATAFALTANTIIAMTNSSRWASCQNRNSGMPLYK